MTDRPVECGHCQKQIKVIYKELNGQTPICSEMCSDCPVLEEKLHGDSDSNCFKNKEGEDSKLHCANCLTTLESIRTGNPLGCSNCYAVFGDILIDDLLLQNKVSPCIQRDTQSKRFEKLHIGKSPQKTTSISSEEFLKSLNLELQEALEKENYEHAASLRDQIKDLAAKNLT